MSGFISVILCGPVEKWSAKSRSRSEVTLRHEADRVTQYECAGVGRSRRRNRPTTNRYQRAEGEEDTSSGTEVSTGRMVRPPVSLLISEFVEQRKDDLLTVLALQVRGLDMRRAFMNSYAAWI